MSFALGNAIAQNARNIKVLQEQVSELQSSVEQLKEIVLNALMKNNPEFKRNAVLADMDDFLRKKIGRTRPPIQNQG